MHFEQLWEQAENTFQLDNKSTEEILNNLQLKIDLYRSVFSKINSAPKEEAEKMKAHLMGEIILTLTNLSYKENINVFHALKVSLEFAKIDNLQQIYQSSPP